MNDRFEEIAETAFDTETLNAAGLPEEGFSTIDNKPQSSTDVLDKSEEDARKAWKDSGSKLSFEAWVAEQEKRANRKAKWKSFGGTLLDIALGWLKNKVDDKEPSLDGGDDTYLPSEDNRIWGMNPWAFAGLALLAVGGTIAITVAIVKSKKSPVAAPAVAV